MNKHCPECEGRLLVDCLGHTRWSVLRSAEPGDPWLVYPPVSLRFTRHRTHAEAVQYATEQARAGVLAAVQSAEGVTGR